MNEHDAESVISWYENLEARALDFKKYVPPVGQNNKTWSPLLAEIIVEACGIVDSVFRNVSSGAEIKRRRKQREKLTINDFCYFFKTSLSLNSRKLILLTSPPEYRTPFFNWSEHQVPDWWKTNTNLKHNRLRYIRQATWGMAIDALAGSLITIAL